MVTAVLQLLGEIKLQALQCSLFFQEFQTRLLQRGRPKNLQSSSICFTFTFYLIMNFLGINSESYFSEKNQFLRFALIS